MQKLKSVALTFALGGVVGIVANGLLDFYNMLGMGMLWATMATLFTLGLAGSLAVATGKYARLEKLGTSLSFLPFYGLGPAVAEAHIMARRAGENGLRAGVRAWGFFFMATGFGIAVAIATGLIVGILS